MTVDWRSSIVNIDIKLENRMTSPKFKAGDKVRYIGGDYHGMCKGSLQVVADKPSRFSGGDFPYVNLVNVEDRGYPDAWFELVESAKPAFDIQKALELLAAAARDRFPKDLEAPRVSISVTSGTKRFRVSLERHRNSPGLEAIHSNYEDDVATALKGVCDKFVGAKITDSLIALQEFMGLK